MKPTEPMKPMKPSRRRALLFFLPLLLLARVAPSQMPPAIELPVKGTAKDPVIFLQLGKIPAMEAGKDPALLVANGQVASHEGDNYVTMRNTDVVAAHKGFGQWKVAFRFVLGAKPPPGGCAFWARWQQGGDPKVCAQTFEVFGGPDEANLSSRGKVKLGFAQSWQWTWVGGGPIVLQGDEMVIEVRNSGAGHDAKVFAGFVLAPGQEPPAPPPAQPPAGASPQGGASSAPAAGGGGASVELPVAGSEGKPVIVLGFGKEPLRRPEADPLTIAALGKIVESPGADSAVIGKDNATVRHKGFGSWGATFLFEAGSALPPGYYTFHARYASGGEISQVKQTFVVLAGPDAASLGPRGTFETVNRNVWKQGWMAGKGTLILLPGDRVIQVVNSGKAHDAKVFAGFELALDSPLAAWLTEARGVLRGPFLAFSKKIDRPERWLYVLDADGPGEEALFKGLAQESLKSWYEATQVKYLLGAESDELAKSLNLPTRPAAVVVDADRKVTGVLANPKDVAQVARFLADPAREGIVPSYSDPPAGEPSALVEGSPPQWLVATGWPGQCGVGHWGLDAEAQQRPNPGDYYAYGYFTAGWRSGHWEERSAGANGVCVITDKLADSFAWSKGTSYAVAYVAAATPTRAVLHLQHSGVESAVYLDGAARPLQPDKAPPFVLARQKPKGGAEVVDRAGQETHDDVSLPQSAQPPLKAELELGKGWHCLVIKMVHGQGKDESVFFGTRLTREDGKPIEGVRARTSDPTAALGMAKAAAGLWPDLSLEGAPGNLPRPGESLKLIADMRVTPSRIPGLGGVYLPLPATLRVRMTDYDGKEIRTFEAKGVFPCVVKFDLGPAPDAGYYSLVPELWAADGRLIRRYPPDGFSVVLGNAAQKERVDKKKLWNSWYYALNERWDSFAPWLERIGMFKNLGSFPGMPPAVEAKWKDAQGRGITLVADFAGDSNWMNNSVKDAEAVVAFAPKYTRWFKSVNEIDGRWGGAEGAAWQTTRQPEKWVERTKWQYEAVHQARPDAIYLGGSLYCSGIDRAAALPILGPRAWFRKCLELGLDRYVDVWDVHAYPQFPPRLEAPSVSNSPKETDLGVIEVMKEVGKTNTKPFILGETSALVWHGFTGMRWQATTVAKMAAWTNSREDWLGIAFCAAHHNRRQTGEEYGMAHNPGEAAIYTAGALIDGLPYKRFKAEDPNVQAAWFGETFMIWRSDDKEGEWTMSLDGSKPWVVVDVVGRTKPLEVKNGTAKFAIGTSPVYVLARAEHERLTRP